MILGTPLRVAMLELSVLSFAQAQSLTERDVIDRFLEQSPRAREIRAQLAATKAELLGRTLLLNPSVFYSREGAGFNEFYEAQQTIPISGRLSLLRRANSAAVSAGESQGRFVLWGLRSDLRLSFYALLVAQEREAVLRRAIDEITAVNRILREREKEGEGSKFDRLRSDRETAELRAEEGVAQALTTEARASVQAFLPKGTPLTRVSGDLLQALSLSPADLLERALHARGDYRSEERQIERFQLEQKAAGRLRFPNPTIAAGLKRADNARGGTDNGAVVSLTFPIALFNRGTTEVERFQAEEARSRARRDLIEQQISAQIEGAYQALVIRQRALENYAKEVSSSGIELPRIARTAYQEGELGILELLDAYRVNRQSELRLIELKFTVRRAQIELERVIGEEVQP